MVVVRVLVWCLVIGHVTGMTACRRDSMDLEVLTQVVHTACISSRLNWTQLCCRCVVGIYVGFALPGSMNEVAVAVVEGLPPALITPPPGALHSLPPSPAPPHPLHRDFQEPSRCTLWQGSPHRWKTCWCWQSWHDDVT
jgi:hypothetical protein